MRSHLPALLLATALAATACAGASDSSADGDTSSPTESSQTTDAGDTTSSTAGDETAATETTVAESENAADTTQRAGLMADLLDTVPLSAYEEAADSGAASIEIDLIDYDAASAMAGLDRPNPTDQDASLDWLVELTRGRSVADGGTGFAANPPRFPSEQSVRSLDETRDELGFTVFDIDRAATLWASPLMVTVASGDSMQLAPSLIDLGNGVMTAGEGDDYESVLEERTAARPLGRPLRLASHNGTVAASLSTPVIESWLAGGPTLSENDRFLAAAEALDIAGSTSGYLIESEFPGLDISGGVELPTVEFSERFGVVGIGSTVVEGRAANVIAYVFDDDASAASVLPELDDVWRTSPIMSSRLLITDYVEVLSVEQVGRVVLVTAAVADERTTFVALELLLVAEPMFVNS